MQGNALKSPDLTLRLNPKSGCVGLIQLLPKGFPGAGENPVKDLIRELVTLLTCMGCLMTGNWLWRLMTGGQEI